jgi:molybdate transport system regulatory protein
MKTKSPQTLSLQPRLRLRVGDAIALGPGKMELLELVQSTGSITEAARQMGMSYMRAWSLIQTMNRCFREPVIRTTRGGQKRGGACLTETGEQVLALYQQMENQCLAAISETQKAISFLLKTTS